MDNDLQIGEATRSLMVAELALRFVRDQAFKDDRLDRILNRLSLLRDDLTVWIQSRG